MERNLWVLLIGALVIGGVVGYALRGPVPNTTVKTTTPTPVAQSTKPISGWDLHIDAKMHFPGKTDKIAHHYCKKVLGLTECQLYDRDREDARLVGVEVIVDEATYDTFDEEEKARWHYHKTEIPKVDAKLPDLSKEEAVKVVKSLEETYGKVYLLWDPSVEELPVGEPSVHILQ